MHTDLSRTPRFRIVAHTTNVVCVHGVLIPIWDFSTSLRFAQNDRVTSTDTVPVIPNVAHARPILLNVTYARCHSERSVCVVKNLLPLIMPLFQIKKDLVFTKSFLTSFLYRPNFGKNLRFLWDKQKTYTSPIYPSIQRFYKPYERPKLNRQPQKQRLHIHQ